MSGMKCAKCGRLDAPFFTDTYDPEEKKGYTFYLCKKCQTELFGMLMDFTDTWGDE